MSRPRRQRVPKLEPELLDHSQVPASVGGATLSPNHPGRVSGAVVFRDDAASGTAPVTIALCDGSQFTFTHFVDLSTAEDA